MRRSVAVLFATLLTAAAFAAPALADLFHRVPLVVGFWGAGGTALMLVVVLAWPSADRVTAAIEEAKRENAAAEAAIPAARLKPTGTAPNGYVPRHAAGLPRSVEADRPAPAPPVHTAPPPPPAHPGPMAHQDGHESSTLRAANA